MYQSFALAIIKHIIIIIIISANIQHIYIQSADGKETRTYLFYNIREDGIIKRVDDGEKVLYCIVLYCIQYLVSPHHPHSHTIAHWQQQMVEVFSGRSDYLVKRLVSYQTANMPVRPSRRVHKYDGLVVT